MKNYLLFIGLFICLQINAQNSDFILRNGKIMDGTGNHWQIKDIAIRNKN